MLMKPLKCGYELIARNEQGASVCFTYTTKKACLQAFDDRYNRKGWKIEIWNLNLYNQFEVIKKTYR